MDKADERSAHLYHRPNDVAGAPAGAISITDHVLLPWEKRCHALLETFNGKGHVTADELAAKVSEVRARLVSP